MHPTITVAGRVGYLFEAAAPGSYCFVPREHVNFADDGKIVVDEVEYFRRGWALRNMRCTPIEIAGTYLFPNPSRLISDFSAAPLRQFLATIAAHASRLQP